MFRPRRAGVAGRVREDTKGKAMHSLDDTVRVAALHGHRMSNMRVSDSGHVHVYEPSDPGCRWTGRVNVPVGAAA